MGHESTAQVSRLLSISGVDLRAARDSVLAGIKQSQRRGLFARMDGGVSLGRRDVWGRASATHNWITSSRPRQQGPHLSGRAVALLTASELLLRVADMGLLRAVRSGRPLRLHRFAFANTDALFHPLCHGDPGNGGAGATIAREKSIAGISGRPTRSFHGSRRGGHQMAWYDALVDRRPRSGLAAARRNANSHSGPTTRAAALRQCGLTPST